MYQSFDEYVANICRKYSICKIARPSYAYVKTALNNMMKTTNERASERANERKKKWEAATQPLVSVMRFIVIIHALAGWLTVATHTHIHSHIFISVCSSSVCKNSLSFQFNKFINFSINGTLDFG